MRNYYLFLIIFFLLFITGCATLRPQPDSRQIGDPLTGPPNGIEIRFLPEQPPIELFEGSDFIIGLELKNNAACDAIGKLCINDLAPSSRGGIIEPLCNDFNIPGATYQNNKPSIEKEEFYVRASSYKNIDRPEGLPVTLEASATYKCRIVAGPQFCVRSTTGEDKTCPQSQVITGNQLKASVGPITITEVKKIFNPESGGVKLVTDIIFSKMNKGYISNEEAIQNPLFISKEDPINTLVDFEGNLMECFGRDFRDNKLYWKTTDENKKTIRCNTLVNVIDRVDGNLNVNLDYVYKVTESKSIKITKLTQNVQ